MGDSESKITYTPEELEEINRIVDFVSEEPPPPPPEEVAPAAEEEPEFDFGAEEDIDDFPADEEGIDHFGEPEDLDLPEGDLSALTEPVADVPEVEEVPESLIIDDLTAEITELDEIEEESVEELGSGELEDITDLISEVGEEQQPAEEPFLEGIEEGEEIGGLDEFEGLEDFGEIETPIEEEPLAEADPGDQSPLDQLNGLTSEEPESLDDQDISSAEDFISDEPFAMEEPETPIEPVAQEEPEMPSLDIGGDDDIPDLSDIALDEPGEIPETIETDIPDIDLSDLGEETPDMAEDEVIPEVSIEDDFDAGDMDLDGFDDTDIGGAEIEEPAGLEGGDIEITTLDELESEDLGDFMADEPVATPVSEEPMEIEMLDDDEIAAVPVAVGSDTSSPEEESIELSTRDMNRLKKAIMLFNPAVRQTIKDTVVQDLLPIGETRQLVDMILTGKPESNIHRFLEKKLNRTISLVDEAEIPGRRVITSRPEYTRVGVERQKRLLKLTKIFGGAFIATIIVALLSYQFLYKPWKAKNLIQDGVTLIGKSHFYKDRAENFQKAEKIFKEVDDDYIKDYTYGYNAYGDAYFKQKVYGRSLNKHNKAYTIDPRNTDTLLKLGQFYSKVPAVFYNDVQGNLNDWYFNKKQPAANRQSQLNMAIHFFKRVLTRDSNNESALYGIGNAYFYQGHFLKAKNYYEKIIQNDKDSVVGHSGLLNLYIEEDKFPRVYDQHSKLHHAEKLDILPRALLAKLASYYIDKQTDKDFNVRIEYGVQSNRFKDEHDKIYPAITDVLRALNKKDTNYPPLHLQYARLNMIKGKYKVMKRYLDKALEKSPTYFDALHLMGEYYYYIKEPVDASNMLKKAIQSYGNQPDFAHEDFYKNTQEIGETNALMGNIFYYFHDKVRLRFGDIDDELLEDEKEWMGNYEIAKQWYENALKENFNSSEVYYNLGRIYYLNKLYRGAMDKWLNIYEDFRDNPELILALGNAFYHMGNLEASKGEFLKLISVYEHESERIRVAKGTNLHHIKVFGTLSSAYNNLGAIYQQQNFEAKSQISYWKAIDYGKQVNLENEFARVNLNRGFRKRKVDYEPILDENIPFSIDVYRAELRK